MEPGAKEREIPALADDWLAQLATHPVRARIVAELEKRSMNAAELAKAIGVPLPQVAYHWRVLGEAGDVLQRSR